LRDIKEDIPLLVNFFLDKYCGEMKKGPKKLTPGALRYLASYPWPGNVRELENEMKRLVVLSHRRTISETDLSDYIYGGSKMSNLGLLSSNTLKETVVALEKDLITEALQTCKQNQLQTAKALGLSRQGLIKKIKRYAIKIS
jgi:DNA-binding NtrC family response regulator